MSTRAHAPGDAPATWHTAPREEVLATLHTTPAGLSEQEAADRRARVGPNRLPEAAATAWWRVLLRQFYSPLIFVLAVAGVVSMAIGEVTDAGFIFAVLGINAIIGGVQEWRAEKSSHALRALVRATATVMRDDEAQELDSAAIVPGDVIWLESGNRVPADARLLSAHGLEIDESLLTGESLAVSKDAGAAVVPDAPLGDRTNMTHAGAIVVRGRAKAVVVETGVRTEVGRLALQVSAGTGGKPPLLLRLERFTRAIGMAVLAAALVVGIIGVIHRGYAVHEMFLFAVALAVSAIPEGLPIALTVALAVAATRMAGRGVIVRRLAAVEGLGSCTLIATDKTGTLTCNELTVRRVITADGNVYTVTGEGYTPAGEVEAAGARDHDAIEALARIGRVAALCNEASLHEHEGAWTWRGDPTDVALLAFAHKLGWVKERAQDDLPLMAEIPFEPERKYAATFHAGNATWQVLVKGAPERVLAMCTADGEEQRALLATAEELAAQGFRVLALAEGAMPAPEGPDGVPEEPADLGFLGFVAMADPLRPGVKDAVARCHAAGVGVTMVTGDHPVTALAIARELGLASAADQVVSGAQLAALEAGALDRLVRTCHVFARVSPQQKLEIVDAARRAGHFVAVTGDGVNDAPALRAANIGVAMGKAGTDVAREAAELIISDDDFSTIVAGVHEGRVAYDNVRKVIYLLISTGAAEVVLVGLSLLAGLPLPLLPVQLLWLNLVTNGIQDVALAFEPAEPGVLARPPRSPTERVFDRLMIERTVIAAVVIGGVGFATFQWLLAAGWSEAAARNVVLLLMVLFENVQIGNARSETTSIFRLSPLRSPLLLAGALIAFLVHVVSMYLPPMQALLGTGPVPLDLWPVLIGLALTAAVAMEAHKLLWARRRVS